MTHPTNVQIPDPFLAYEICEALDLEEGEPIPESKLQELTELYTEGPSHAPGFFDDEEQGITDLTGLEKATGLVQLHLSDHSLMNDLRPLAGLQNLQSLDLSDTSAEDVTPLSGLQNLRFLDLRGTRRRGRDTARWTAKLTVSRPHRHFSIGRDTLRQSTELTVS